jgi:hypothetical protein
VTRDVHIIAVGACTPVGRTAESSAAAIRAGISRVREHPFMVDGLGERLKCAYDPALESETLGVERLLALARHALCEVAAKVTVHDVRIDWRRDAVSIDRQVRAFDPTPGAVTLLGDSPVKVWQAEPIDAASAVTPGAITIENDALVVACGDGALRITELQPAGGRRMSARAFAAGRLSGSAAKFAAWPA